VRESTAIYADIGRYGEEKLFISQVLTANLDDGQVRIAYGIEKSINSRLFDHPLIRFKANYQKGRLAFLANRPSDTIFRSKPAIQFAFPKAMLHYYREQPRLILPTDVSLRCIVNEKGTAEPFELKVVDISHDGMGCILYQNRKALQKGSVLKDCRIILPNGDVTVVDLMVRYTTQIKLINGIKANRTGIRFIQRPTEIQTLIEQFIQQLDDTDI